jgi:hypothetical protein
MGSAGADVEGRVVTKIASGFGKPAPGDAGQPPRMAIHSGISVFPGILARHRSAFLISLRRCV